MGGRAHQARDRQFCPGCGNQRARRRACGRLCDQMRRATGGTTIQFGRILRGCCSLTVTVVLLSQDPRVMLNCSQESNALPHVPNAIERSMTIRLVSLGLHRDEMH